MNQINNAQARLFAETKVWQNHSKAVEKQYNNKSKINGDTHLQDLISESLALIPKIAIEKYKGGDVALLEERKSQVKGEIQAALQKYGMVETDIEFEPTCEKCGDTGKVENGDCDCFKKYMFEYISSRLSSGEEVDFESSKEFAKAYPELAKFYDYAEVYCEKYPDVSKNIIFMEGAVGTGKSHLAKGMLGKLVAKGASGLFVSAFTMADTFTKHLYNATSFTPSKKINDEFALLLNVDILVVDDLGAEVIHTQKIKPYFINLIENRMMAGKLTIFTSNLEGNEIKDNYGERFFSRLTAKNTLVMGIKTGTDLRKK